MLRRFRTSSSAPRPFVEISGSISFSSLSFPFPETVPNSVCHFKGSLQIPFVATVSGRELRPDWRVREEFRFRRRNHPLGSDGTGDDRPLCQAKERNIAEALYAQFPSRFRMQET